MKKLLLKHGNLILNVLMIKYDKKCHLFQNKATSQTYAPGGKFSRGDRVLSFDSNSKPDCKDEFLAVYIGQLIRLYAKSKSLSKSFQNFEILSKIITLMQHDQFII
jgi:hypothetical protein